MQAQQLMTQPVITCNANDSVNVAAQKMWDHDCGAIPVVNDEGRLVGIVTDRDACMAAYTTGEPLPSIPVSTAMAHGVISCRLEDSFETVAQLMREARIRRVPVVDANDRPIGLLSLSDVARSGGMAHDTKGFDQELVQTLASVSEPRESVAISEPRRPKRSKSVVRASA